MSRVIVLDAGLLGLVTNPKLSAEGVACARWLQTHITSGSRAIIPEIADYEVRRELLRANKTKGIARLDNLVGLYSGQEARSFTVERSGFFSKPAYSRVRPSRRSSPMRSRSIA
ncbi:hypothetical protein [Phormidesmis priestleyi]